MKEADTKKIAFALHALADNLEANGGMLLRNNVEWKPGIAASVGREVRGGDTPDPTSNGKADDLTVLDGHDLVWWLHRLEGDAGKVRTLMAKLTTRDRDTVDLAPSASCTCCAAVVTCVGNDRLRGGYCPACNMAYTRAGKPVDRAKWERGRRNFLDTPVTA